MDSYDIIEHLKCMFEGQACQEKFDTFISLHACKQGEHDPVIPHVQRMIGYIEYLANLGAPIAVEHHIDLFLQSLNNSYSQFVMNYNMNEIDKNPTELLAMLKTVETNVQKASPTPMLMVNKGKAKGKGFVLINDNYNICSSLLFQGAKVQNMEETSVSATMKGSLNNHRLS
ncbi:hypothetical protein AgCh_015807 [Apium graveolens]